MIAIPPEDLIKNELHTLEVIMNRPGIRQEQPELARLAEQECLKGEYRSNNSFSFSPWIYFPITKRNKVTKALLECLIISNPQQSNVYEMLTYSFSLFKLDDERKDCLVKRFHIDFTYSSDTGRPPLHPIFHLQSPGKLSPILQAYGINDAHLDPSISEPRLYCAPTSLALLTDFLLREFGGDHSSPLTKITKERYWRSLIKKNEDLVLKPYFNACSQFFDDRQAKNHSQLFSQDFVYGQS